MTSARRHFRPGLLAAGLAGLLAACDTLFPSPQGPCPTVSIVGDAARLTQYREGPGRDLTDVRYRAEISNVQFSCRYRRDGGLTAALAIDIVATRGPAAEDGSGNFPFFVAIADSRQNILAKEVFDSAIEFAPRQRRAGVREEIDQELPLAGEDSGANYEVLVGFQLTAEQLEQNRR